MTTRTMPNIGRNGTQIRYESREAVNGQMFISMALGAGVGYLVGLVAGAGAGIVVGLIFGGAGVISRHVAMMQHTHDLNATEAILSLRGGKR